MKKINWPKSAWIAAVAFLSIVIVVPMITNSEPGPLTRPHIDAAVWSSRVSVVDFPVAIPVELHIDGFNDGSFDVDQTSTTDSAGFSDFNLGDMILKPGDRVVVVGPGLIHELIVASVHVNAVDVSTRTLSGLSPPHTEVDVLVESGRNDFSRVATTSDARGNWTISTARFQGIDDRYLVRAVVYDADGDATHSSREVRVA